MLEFMITQMTYAKPQPFEEITSLSIMRMGTYFSNSLKKFSKSFMNLSFRYLYQVYSIP